MKTPESRSLSRNRALILPLLLGLSMQVSPVLGVDKSGVSPNSISLPKGPGSIEGLGESFQPSLNTGTAKYGLGLRLPPGTAGHQPSLALSYDGGGGNGPLGFGWNLETPRIQRRTDQGIPTYGVDLGVDRVDSFINENRETLVPTEDGFFFCENESAFVRYRFVGDHWEATLPNGTRLDFGVTTAGRITDGDSARVFAWLLERATDTHGNAIEYRYRAFAGESNRNQKYLAEIRYGPGAGPWKAFHMAIFEYEDRPDWFEDGRAGFLIRTGKRLRSVHIGTQGSPLTNHLAGDFNADGVTDYLNRRYDLEYLHSGGLASHWSLLAKVTMTGADGVTALPPATFDYAVSNPPESLDASSKLWGGVDEPASVMDNPLVDLIDLNGDGLPDVLRTAAGGGVHSVAVNRGPVRLGKGWGIKWAESQVVGASGGSAWNFDLASSATHLADMNGDGLADLVHKTAEDAVFYYANRGHLAWDVRQDMSLEESAPPAPFGNPSVRTADLDFDKRMDIVQSLDLGGSLAYRVWFNRQQQSYSAPITRELEGGFDFATPGVQIADANGDRVPDVVRIRPGALEMVAGLGYGRFAPAVRLTLPDLTLEESQIARAQVIDINGDGLADLVVERAAPGQCWYWLNLGNHTLSTRRVITGLPAVTPETAVRWADLDGNGTTDLIYADSTAETRLQMVDLGQIVGGGLSPNVLVRIANGLGRVITIGYAPSTTFALADAEAGRPWPEAVPFPVTVVENVVMADSLGHQYTNRFRYHEGYYDAVEKQFRGFAHVEQIELGDATAPTLVSRSRFDTGRTFDAMKGRLLQISSETEEGAVFNRATTAWSDPPRVLRTGTNGLTVRFAHPISTLTEITERGRGTPRRLESALTFDEYGNVIRQEDFGVVENGDRSAFDDERITTTQYALNLERWILRLPARKEVQDEQGVVLSRSESFYDDESFTGINFGVVDVGDLTLKREWINPAQPGAFVPSARTRYDAYGNPFQFLDPLSDAAGDPRVGHFRELSYDEAFHAYPIREVIHVGGGAAPLMYEASYDVGFGTVATATDFNGFPTTYAHDALGRLISVIKPGDSPDLPTIEYGYALGVLTELSGAGGLLRTGVVNYVETRQLDRGTELPGSKRDHYYLSRQYQDGLGRALMTRSEAEPAPESQVPRVAVTGATLYNARQKVARQLQPFFTTRSGSLEDQLAFESVEAPGWRGQFHQHGALLALDLPSAQREEMWYDATLRLERQVHADGSFSRVEFEPLVSRSFDEDDTDAESPHFATPTVQFSDGLGRLIQLDETVRLDDEGHPTAGAQTWTSRFAYDLNDCLTRITDAQNNVKRLYYDGLRRKVAMDDPDAGPSTNRYDPASNLSETIDAKGQRISYTYDGANRILTEDYQDEESPEFSYHRTPDVKYVYDVPAGPVELGDGTRATPRHVKGLLAWVADTVGEEHVSYDARGRIEWTVKRLPDPELSPDLTFSPTTAVSYRTAFEYDSQDRVRRMTYPDHDEVTYRYNERSLLTGIDGGAGGSLLAGVDFLPSAQQAKVRFGNGVETTYAYDRRMRLNERITRQVQRDLELVHFGYELDAKSNVRAIHDLRPSSAVPMEDPRRNTQQFEYDDLYRLTGVRYNAPNGPTSNGGMIQYRYDRIGNMLAQTSDLRNRERGVPVADLGTMSYGGAAGRFGRATRVQDGSPGPHALTSISPATGLVRRFPFDANGNMTDIDGLHCTWDVRDRLVAAENEQMRADYRYDYKGRRVIKRVRWKQPEPAQPGTTAVTNVPSARTAVLYPSPSFEVRPADEPVKFVYHQGRRLARVTGSLASPRRLQRLRLLAGWNLVSLAVGTSNLLAQLGQGASDGAPLISAAYRWLSDGSGYRPLTADDWVPAGSVLWIRAAASGVVGVTGEYVEPVPRFIAAGGVFVPGPGLEPWPCPSPIEGTQWLHDPGQHLWRAQDDPGSGLLADAFPSLLPPGGVLFVNSSVPLELPPPLAENRVLYYHPDHLGSASVLSDRKGETVVETAHHPFGEVRYEHRTRRVDGHYGFTQKEKDRESGLHYFESRFLAGAVARFLSVDAKYLNPDLLESGELGGVLANPGNFNLYAYALNNPVRYTDPSGHSPWSWFRENVWIPGVDDWDELDGKRTAKVAAGAALLAVPGAQGAGGSLLVSTVAVGLAADQISSGIAGTDSLVFKAGSALCGGNEACGTVAEIGTTLGLSAGPAANFVAARTATVQGPMSVIRTGAERTFGGAVRGGGGVLADTAVPMALENTGVMSRTGASVSRTGSASASAGRTAAGSTASSWRAQQSANNALLERHTGYVMDQIKGYQAAYGRAPAQDLVNQYLDEADELYGSVEHLLP